VAVEQPNLLPDVHCLPKEVDIADREPEQLPLPQLTRGARVGASAAKLVATPDRAASSGLLFS
jgi:hypothetical protein